MNRYVWCAAVFLGLFPSCAVAYWFLDRNNEMSPVLLESDNLSAKVARAMGVVFTKQGETQSTQVCKGVYLGAAHGVYHSAKLAREEGTERRPVTEQWVKVLPYPTRKDKIMWARTEAQFLSNWIGITDVDAPTTTSDDWVLISVDRVFRPDDFIVPLDATIEELNELRTKGLGDFFLYRGGSVFDFTINGVPDGNNDTKKRLFSDLKEIYKYPYRVNKSCLLQDFPPGVFPDRKLISTDCPTENHVSGAPIIFEKGDQAYLVGIAETERHPPKGQDAHQVFRARAGNRFIAASSFCDGYQTRCNASCANAADLLNEPD